MKCILFVVFVMNLAQANDAEDFWKNTWLESYNKSLSLAQTSQAETGYYAETIDPVFASLSSDYERAAYKANWNYEARKDLAAASKEIYENLNATGAFFDDPELTDYLYQLLFKVHPGSFPPGRPGCLNIRVLKDSSPNAFAMCDGTIVVNTGLLSLLRSENELTSILAHEVSHVVLDHNLKNSENKKALESLSLILGGIAAGVVSYQLANEGYSPDFAIATGISIGVQTTIIADKTLDVVGAIYSRSQEAEADKLAKRWLYEICSDSISYDRALVRLGEYGRISGEGSHTSLMDSHSSIKTRLKSLKGDYAKFASTNDMIDTQYDKRVSSAHSLNAAKLIYERDFLQAEKLIDRAIQSNWYSGNDMMIKAMLIRLTNPSDSEIDAALLLLDSALMRQETANPWIFAEKGLLQMRKEMYSAASTSFKSYLEALSERKADNAMLIKWTDTMISKLSAFKN